MVILFVISLIFIILCGFNFRRKEKNLILHFLVGWVFENGWPFELSVLPMDQVLIFLVLYLVCEEVITDFFPFVV